VLTGPTDDTVTTPSASLGMLRQVALSIVRSCAAPSGKSGLDESGGGLPRSLEPFPAAVTSVTPRARA
jgi:hypothetical protein